MGGKSGSKMEKVDLLEARGGSYEPAEPPLATPMEVTIILNQVPFCVCVMLAG